MDITITRKDGFEFITSISDQDVNILIISERPDIFIEDCRLHLSLGETLIYAKGMCDSVVFSFGGIWYRSSLNPEYEQAAHSYYDKIGTKDLIGQEYTQHRYAELHGYPRVSLNPFKYEGKVFASSEFENKCHQELCSSGARKIPPMPSTDRGVMPQWLSGVSK